MDGIDRTAKAAADAARVHEADEPRQKQAAGRADAQAPAQGGAQARTRAAAQASVQPGAQASAPAPTDAEERLAAQRARQLADASAQQGSVPDDHPTPSRKRQIYAIFAGLLLAMFVSSLSETVDGHGAAHHRGRPGRRGPHAVGHHGLHSGRHRHDAHLRQAGRPVRAASICWSSRRCRSSSWDRPCAALPPAWSCSSWAAPWRAWAAAGSSSCRRPPSPTSSRRASEASTWASSAPCSRWPPSWGRFWAAGSCR